MNRADVRWRFLLLMVLLTISGISVRADVRSTARKLSEECMKQYTDGKYEKALQSCLKSAQLYESIGSPGASVQVARLYIGTLYAQRGDMQQACENWMKTDWSPDTGTMMGISDPRVRLSGQILAHWVREFAAHDIDPYGRGVVAADGLTILLRKQGLSADAETMSHEADILRGRYKSERSQMTMHLSDILGALANGMAAEQSQAAGPTPSSIESGGSDVQACLARKDALSVQAGHLRDQAEACEKAEWQKERAVNYSQIGKYCPTDGIEVATRCGKIRFGCRACYDLEVSAHCAELERDYLICSNNSRER